MMVLWSRAALAMWWPLRHQLVKAADGLEMEERSTRSGNGHHNGYICRTWGSAVDLSWRDARAMELTLDTVARA